MKMFDYGKTRMIGLPCGEKNCDDMLSRFHPILGRYGRTDGRTDRRTDRIVISISRVSVVTRDNNVSKTLNVKSHTVIDCLQLSDTETRDEKKMTSFPKSCIFIFWVNRPTQNLTG